MRQTTADWIRSVQNLLITGATGCGKTWLGCALAHQAARSGFSVLYTRAGWSNCPNSSGNFSCGCRGLTQQHFRVP